MSKERQKLLQDYQALEQYFAQAVANPEQLALVTEAERIATQFYQAGHSQRLLFSQLALTPADLSYPSQLAFKQWVLLHTIAAQLQWPVSYVEDLLACALFRLSAVAGSLQQLPATEQQQQLLQKAGLYRLKLSGAGFSHRQWRQLLTDSSLNAGQKAAWQRLPHADTILFSCQLAFAITPTLKRAAVGLEQVLRSLCLQRQTAETLALMDLVAAAGPSLYLCGRFCSDSIGNLLFITEATPKLIGHVFDINSKKLISQHQEITEPSLKLMAPRRLPEPQWLDYFNDSAHEAVALLPPLDLLQLRQLDPQQSIRQQVRWLQQFPQCEAFLLQQASLLNRQQKTVTQLQHAVALIGAEQLPQLLKQAWLTEQITALAQPYRHWFQQFSHCLAQALHQLSQLQPTLALSQAQAQLLASCLSYSLQQDDRCRYLPLHAAGSKLSPLVHQCYLNCWKSTELPRQTALLAASMGLPQVWQEAVLHFREPLEIAPPYRPSQQARLVFAFSLQLTEALFYGVVARPQYNEHLYLQLCQALTHPTANWLQWLQLLLEHADCFWPLQPDL